MKPLTPQEAQQSFNNNLPDFVIESANELIVENLDSYGGAHFTFDDLEERIKSKMTGDTEFNHKWLDVEDVFRKFGWSVSVDKPGYCETYKGNYTFKPKKG